MYQTETIPTLKEFESLCQAACRGMNEKAALDPAYYLLKGGRQLEEEVERALNQAAENTPFQGRIQVVSGQKFPDIVVCGYYGIEVKSTQSDKWELIGGSVAEGTRVEGVEHIYLLFGKLSVPVAFKTRRYEDCLADIAVTHSPRYKINMDLEEGETIFDKMGVRYEELRHLEQPLRPVVKYFKSTLKPGETLWWVNETEPDENAAPAKIRMWNTLPADEKYHLVSAGLALFPELFSQSNNKYQRFTLWLAARHGVVSSSMRDSFSAGGQVDLCLDGRRFQRVPRKYEQLREHCEGVKRIIENTDLELLKDYWNIDRADFKNRLRMWIEIVSEQAKESFDVKELLTQIFYASQRPG